MDIAEQASAPPLSGDELDTFLRETEALIEQEQQAGVATPLLQATLASHLGSHAYRVDDLDQLNALYSAWLQANNIDAALRIIDEQEPRVLAGMGAAEREDKAVRLAFWRVHALKDRPADERLPLAAEHAARLLDALPGEQQSEDSWTYLVDLMRDAGLHDLSRKFMHTRHRLVVSRPGRKNHRAWDDAVLAINLGHSHLAEQDDDAAAKAARAALDSLRQADPEQELDHEDWLRLGNSLIELDHQTFEIIRDQVRKLIPDNYAQPRRRDIEVRLSRLEARTLYRRSRLADALEKGTEGRFGLTRDDDDSFSAEVLDWLIEAGRLEAAAQLAFECAFMEREGSKERACRHALRWLDEAPEATPYWALTLAYASTIEDLAWVAEGEEPNAFFKRHLALARQYAPNHPAADLIEAISGPEKDERAWHAAWRLLENATHAPELQHSDALYLTYKSRIRIHGPKAGLELPAIESAGAGWNYDIGVKLDYDIENEFPEADWQETRLTDLVIRHYESGLQRYEHFFASGQGNYRDGDIHTYSMLCNNLGIKYRTHLREFDKAIALHRKGIESSPFAEHFDGIMSCYLEKGNAPAEFVSAAEQLWEFASEYGYSRHAPAEYIHEVCIALSNLERFNELPIWLQRLDEWWSSLDDGEQNSERMAYFDALIGLLSNIAWRQPADALARLESSLQALRATRRVDYIELSARILDRAGQYERAIELYEEALALPFDKFDEPFRNDATRFLAECRDILGGGEKKAKSWWKFWN